MDAFSARGAGMNGKGRTLGDIFGLDVVFLYYPCNVFDLRREVSMVSIEH